LSGAASQDATSREVPSPKETDTSFTEIILTTGAGGEKAKTVRRSLGGDFHRFRWGKGRTGCDACVGLDTVSGVLGFTPVAL